MVLWNNAKPRLCKDGGLGSTDATLWLATQGNINIPKSGKVILIHALPSSNFKYAKLVAAPYLYDPAVSTINLKHSETVTV